MRADKPPRFAAKLIGSVKMWFVRLSIRTGRFQKKVEANLRAQEDSRDGPISTSQAKKIERKRERLRERLEDRHRKQLAIQQGYQAGSQDIFVATIGKSGTNWALQMAQQIAWHGESEYEHIHQFVAWLERPELWTEKYRNNAFEQQSPTGLRVIKTHTRFGLLPYSDESKYITIFRDPKEICVSGYYFFLKERYGLSDKHLKKVPIDLWFRMYLSEGGFGERWATHVAEFWSVRDKENVLILQYLEMKNDLRGSIKQMAELMKVSLMIVNTMLLKRSVPLST